MPLVYGPQRRQRLSPEEMNHVFADFSKVKASLRNVKYGSTVALAFERPERPGAPNGEAEARNQDGWFEAQIGCMIASPHGDFESMLLHVPAREHVSFTFFVGGGRARMAQLRAAKGDIDVPAERLPLFERWSFCGRGPSLKAAARDATLELVAGTDVAEYFAGKDPAIFDAYLKAMELLHVQVQVPVRLLVRPDLMGPRLRSSNPRIERI